MSQLKTKSKKVYFPLFLIIIPFNFHKARKKYAELNKEFDKTENHLAAL